jgi:TRAP-type C4-dicarboxylate transport system permease small subunit
MTPHAPPPPTLPERALLLRLTAAVAIAGGVVSLAAAVLVTTSVTGRWFGYGSINGDFDFVQIAVAVSVFCFLPFTQARRGNIVVDSLTAKLPARTNRIVDAFWDLVYAAAAAVLAWSLFNGAREALANNLQSFMLGVPLGPVFVVCAALLVLLAATAVGTAIHLLRRPSRSGP